MRTTRPFYGRRSSGLGSGPQVAFAAAIVAGIVTWTVLFMTLPHLMAPMVATLLLLFAGGLALLSWRRADEHPARVSYADAAGALTLIGLCVAATIEPDQLARLITSNSTQP